MFTAIFTKSIYNGKTPNGPTAVAIFKRKEFLPFAPIPETFLCWPHDTEHYVGKVTWNFDDEVFLCDLADDVCESGSESKFESIVNKSIAAGWELVSKKQFERKKSFWEKNA